jgi:transcriptional regulator with XRE-family HTH domain
MAADKNKKSPPVLIDLDNAFREIIFEMPEDELAEALQEEGRTLRDVAAMAKQAAATALEIHRSSQTNQTVGYSEALHRGLGVLLQLLRRREGVSEEALALHAHVDVGEVRRIEFDPSYTPKPRTVYKLEKFFGLPERSLVLLSGATRKADEEIQDKALRFAAHSTALGKLTPQERKILNDFVRFLGSKAES